MIEKQEHKEVNRMEINLHALSFSAVLTSFMTLDKLSTFFVSSFIKGKNEDNNSTHFSTQ